MNTGSIVRGATNVALALAALVLTLVVLEGLLALLDVGGSSTEGWRTRGLQQADEELIYSMRPSSRRAWKTSEFTEHASINSIGLRGPEVSPDADGRLRILILGDSMTYGHGVANYETYPGQLAKLFAEQAPDVEVINAGTRGYGSDHSYKLFMTRLRELSPRIVIFALNYNDLADNLNYPLYNVDDDQLVPLDATRSPLYLIATWSERLPDWLADWRIARLAIQSGVRLATRGYRPTESGQPPAGEEMRKMVLQFESMAEAARQDGFELLVLGLPSRDQEWKLFVWLQEPLEGVAPLLDLSLDPRWRQEKERWFFPVNEHLDVAGNLQVAQILYDYITERGWLERGWLEPDS